VLDTYSMNDLLDFANVPRLGTVVRVDPRRIDVALLELTFGVTMDDLVALPISDDAFLIGLVEVLEGTVRAATEQPPRYDASAEVIVRIMPIGTLYTSRDESAPTFQRGATPRPRLGDACYLLDGERLRAFMSVAAGGVSREEQLVLGRYLAEHSAAAIADGNRMFQRHVSLLGSTGAGKSWAVALMLERASRLGHANLVVFDLHGEYAALTKPVAGRPPVARALRIAGPADRATDGDDLLYLPYWLLKRDELMALILDPTGPYAADQILRVGEHMQTLKGAFLTSAGREESVPTFTAESPIPYPLEHLIDRLRHDNVEKIPRHPANILDPGPFFGRFTGLLARIEACRRDPRYGFIFKPPEHALSYDWLAKTATQLVAGNQSDGGIKVIDLSEVPSAVLPLVIGVLGRLAYDVHFWMQPEARSPLCLVCDEAHLYLPAKETLSPMEQVALDAFEAIAKEGRKYGIALLVVSQRPTDLSSTVLSQCNNFIVMRLTNEHDRAMVERLLPETLTGIAGLLPTLGVGEAVVIGDAVPLPTPIKFDTPNAVPSSVTQDYWTLWSEHETHESDVSAGVEAFRNQRHGRTLQ
jgi:uncharacterized protein DUF87